MARTGTARPPSARPSTVGPAADAPRFQALLRHSGVIIAVLDAELRITEIADSVTAVLGYLPEHLVGRSIGDLLAEDDRGRLDQLAGRIRASRPEPVSAQASIRSLDGTLRLVEATFSDLGEDPTVGGIVVAGTVVNAREVTERHEAEEKLRQSEARFRALVRNASDIIAIVDRDGRIRYVSPGVENLTGYRPEELVGTSSLAFSHPDEAVAAIARFEELVRHRGALTAEHRILHRDRTVRWVETTLTDRLDDPDICGVVVNVRDITESKTYGEALERSERSFRTLAGSLPTGVLRLDPSGRITYCNDRFRELAGLGPGHESHVAADLIHPSDRQTATDAWFTAVEQKAAFDRRLRFTGPAGQVRWGDVRATPLIDDHGDLVGYVAIAEDVSEDKLREDRLAHEATHDPLTGLPNRTLLFDRLDVALARARRAGSRVAVLFCDLDHFKTVNDRWGHAAGDGLLVRFAGILRDRLRPGDTVARFGGDEFVVLCEDVADLAEAEQIAARVRDAFDQPLDLDGHEVRVTGSTGIALSGPSTPDGESLVQEADAAMYRAKSHGRARHAVFDATMRDEASERSELQRGLQRAVADGRLDLLYQPVVALGTGDIVGVEALVRWDRPGVGVQAPPHWLPVAEESGLIVPIGRWIAEHAMAAAVRWEAVADRDPPWLALNLSSRQLEHPGLVDDLVGAAAGTGLATDRLVLEVTESAANARATGEDGVLAALRGRGMRIAIDDVGSGESSLVGLGRFPPDLLKIDRELVAELGRSGVQRTVIEAVVALAASLEVEVVAEGVETEAEVAQLRSTGCRLGQGFHLCPPVDLDQLLERLAVGAVTG